MLCHFEIEFVAVVVVFHRFTRTKVLREDHLNSKVRWGPPTFKDLPNETRRFGDS